MIFCVARTSLGNEFPGMRYLETVEVTGLSETGVSKVLATNRRQVLDSCVREILCYNRL